MTRTEKIIIIVAIVLAGIILVPVGYALGETVGALLALVFVAFFAVFAAGFFSNNIVLNEMEVGVVFDRHDNFVCFLDNEYGRILPRKNDDDKGPERLSKPKTRHRINPADEVLKSKLRKGSFDANGVAKDIRTREGIPINVPWKVSFRIEVLRIKPGIEYKLARVLPEYADKMVTGRMLQILQHVVGEKNIKELYEATGDRSAIQLLEIEIRDELLARAAAIGVTGIDGHDLKIGPIELPGKIEATLRDTHQRILYADTLANSLQKLQQVLHAFSPEDMERLTELERLRIIDEKAKSLVLSESFVNARKQKNVNFYEELEQNGGNGKGYEGANGDQ